MTDKTLPNVQTDNPGVTVQGTDIFLSRQSGSAIPTQDSAPTANQVRDFVFTQGRTYPNRVVTAAGNVTVVNTDYYIGVNKTTGAATVVNLPAGTNGKVFWIKDEKLDAATNNITITPAAGNIVGTTRAATFVMNANGQGAIIIYNGTEWIVVSQS